MSCANAGVCNCYSYTAPYHSLGLLNVNQFLLNGTTFLGVLHCMKIVLQKIWNFFSDPKKNEVGSVFTKTRLF